MEVSSWLQESFYGAAEEVRLPRTLSCCFESLLLIGLSLLIIVSVPQSLWLLVFCCSFLSFRHHNPKPVRLACRACVVFVRPVLQMAMWRAG